MTAVQEQVTPVGYGSMRRKEDARFVRGKGLYIDDVHLRGMLHGAVLRSPHAHARIRSHRRLRGAGASQGPRGHHR